MKISGNLIITDPCYFAKNEHWSNGRSGFNWSTPKNMTIDHNLGFTEYLWDSTGVGDGRWKVSQIRDKIMSGMELEKFIEDIEDAYYTFFRNGSLENQIKLEDLVGQRETIGRYCVDSGTYGVFLLDEVLKYDPSFLVENGSHCYTIVQDFSGDVDIYEDSRNQSHIIGVGNKSFYSNTVSWL